MNNKKKQKSSSWGVNERGLMRGKSGVGQGSHHSYHPYLHPPQ